MKLALLTGDNSLGVYLLGSSRQEDERRQVCLFLADFTVVAVRLTKQAVARNLLSQVMLPDHTDLLPSAALQVQNLLRLDHPRTSGNDHVWPLLLVIQLLCRDACKH